MPSFASGTDNFETLSLFVEFLDEPALVELGDETRVDKLFRLMAANIRSCLAT